MGLIVAITWTSNRVHKTVLTGSIYSRDDVCTVTDALLIPNLIGPLPARSLQYRLSGPLILYLTSLLISRLVFCRLSCSSASNDIGSRDEKTLLRKDYLDEAADGQGGELADGVTRRGPSAADRTCLSCRRCCDPYYSCSSRLRLALLSAVGFCISLGIRCNMDVALYQMTRDTERYAVSPLLPGYNFTVEVVSFYQTTF